MLASALNLSAGTNGAVIVINLTERHGGTERKHEEHYVHEVFVLVVVGSAGLLSRLVALRRRAECF
jgi:hypothetical protein